MSQKTNMEEDGLEADFDKVSTQFPQLQENRLPQLRDGFMKYRKTLPFFG